MKSRIVYILLSLGFCTSLCLSSRQAQATPPDMTPGIGVTVRGIDTRACVASEGSLPLSFDIVNATGQNIVIKEWDSKGVRYLGKDLGKGLAVDGTLFYEEDALTLDDTRFQEDVFFVNNKEKLTIRGKLRLPKANGYYKEIVTLYWSLAGEDRIIDTQVLVPYVVNNGCATKIDLNEYEDAVNPPEFLVVKDEFAEQGISQVILHRGKAEKRTLAKGESIDWAVPADLASQEFYDDDVALNFKTGAFTPMETKSVLNLTYCVRVQYLDNWDHRPINTTDTTGMRWWRPRTQEEVTYPNPANPPVNFHGLWVELWDKDNSGGG